jgi:sigma-B regulation protein RsbU (phosphoserine phosphatase)
MSPEESATVVERTPHRAVDDALHEEDADELYEQAPCGYLSMLPDGTIVKVNATLLSWTGHERDDLVGRRFQHLLPPGARIYHETHVSPMLRLQGMVREIALELLRADGGRLPVVMNAEVRCDSQGVPRVVRAALFDATERRAYEHELVVARQAAEAAERRARALAETLQASLLPPELLSIPDLDIAGAYRPSGDGFEVGGDFYDVFETGRGTWGVVLGDVCGKGAAAATVTSLARYTVRAEGLRTPYPSAVLASLHDAMCRFQPDRFCTALFGVIDRLSGAFRLTIASGGHPLPLLLRDGQLARIGTAGTLLGMVDAVELRDTTTTLHPGDVIVLHTDGVTEARRDGSFLDDAGLEAIILGADQLDARDLADEIVRRTVEFQAGVPRDDIAVVVLRVPR